MGLVFEGEEEEEHLHRENKTQKNKKPKAYMIIIIVLAAVLVLVLVWGLVVQKYFPSLRLFGEASADTNTQQVINDEESDWAVVERVNVAGEEGFRLMLPAGVGLSDITIENHYRDRALLIRLKNVPASYMKNACVKGNISDISVAAWRVKDGEVLLSLQMSEVWEYEVSQENGELLVKNVKASDTYETVVVIDPVVWDSLTDDVTAMIGEAVSSKAAEEGIKVYLTRGNGGARSEAERLALIVDAEPDYVVEITVASDADSSKYGMSAAYNTGFYNPECENVTVADALLRNSALAASNKAIAINPASEESILRFVQVPAAGISVGYMSNAEERELLLNEYYRERIADGILQGIRELIQVNQ